VTDGVESVVVEHVETQSNRKMCKKYSERYEEDVLEYKRSTPCADCGQYFPACVMDFDHVLGVKYKSLSKMMYSSTQSRIAEMAKCELVCSNCHRVRTEQRRNENRKTPRCLTKAGLYVQNLKRDGRCCDCNTSYAPIAMDYDHVCGTKTSDIAKLSGRKCSITRLEEEIAKCELVCSNCHRIRTYTRNQELKQAA
jgi:hypothetical protein